jgi:hypothetical protein
MNWRKLIIFSFCICLFCSIGFAFLALWHWRTWTAIASQQKSIITEDEGQLRALLPEYGLPRSFDSEGRLPQRYYEINRQVDAIQEKLSVDLQRHIDVVEKSRSPAFVRVSLVFLLCSALCGAWLGWGWLRMRRWKSDNRCAVCGYSLTGNKSGVCPECGTPVNAGGVPSPGI